MAERMLFIGAHPDDYEIGAGMLIAKAVAAGNEVFGIMVTDGEMSGVPRGNSRRSEGQMAGEMLGLQETYFLGLPDTKLKDHYDTIRDELEKLVSEINPNEVFTHGPNDRHLDHTIVYDTVNVAARKAPALWGFRSPSATPQATFETYFPGNEALMARKFEVLATAYASQVHKDGIVDLDKIRSESQFFSGVFLPYSPGALVEPLTAVRGKYNVPKNGVNLRD